jgi:hypothetical protein
VASIDRHGVWLPVRDREYFLPYEQYPWFRDAPVRHVLEVRLLHDRHLHWPALDVDLSIDILEQPDAYPLTYE